MDSAQNIVLMDGPGIGKTHLATAIDIQAIGQYRRHVRCFSTIELVNTLGQEKHHGKAGQLAARLLHTDLGGLG